MLGAFRAVVSKVMRLKQWQTIFKPSFTNIKVLAQLHDCSDINVPHSECSSFYSAGLAQYAKLNSPSGSCPPGLQKYFTPLYMTGCPALYFK